jgi:hypothetical protein
MEILRFLHENRHSPLIASRSLPRSLTNSQQPPDGQRQSRERITLPFPVRGIGAILIAGVGALAIDNIERPLGGGLISKILTEEKISVRVFGKLQRIVAELLMLVTFTGNNLKFKNDITARKVALGGKPLQTLTPLQVKV